MEIKKILGTLLTNIGFNIFLFGVIIRYYIPSVFTFLKGGEITYFGGLLIEFGLLFLIGNWLIDKYKQEIYKSEFIKVLDKKLGLKKTPLLTELINMQNPFKYHILDYNEYNTIKKDKKRNKNPKYFIEQIVLVKLVPKKDNVHYAFSRGVDNKHDLKNIKILYIKINGNLITKEFIEDKILENRIDYLVRIPLKENKDYVIEIKTIYPPCMSDLSDGKEYDSFGSCFNAFTERITLTYCFTDEYFKPNNYYFYVERSYMNLPDIEHIECGKIKSGIELKYGNLKNGDKLRVIYTKKNKA